MKGSHVRYTLSEDNFIAECVRKSPLNLMMAFEDAGKALGRKTRSIESRYYSRVRFMFKMFYIETVHQDKNLNPYIMISGDGTVIYNVKNLVRR